MKKIYNFLLCLLALTDLTFAQGPNDLNEGFHLGYSAGTNAFTISWWGRSNRNYFVQQTDDLKNWIYLPSMGSGSNQVIQWGVTSSSIKSFFRLQFDNDLNGLPDAWEKAFYGHTGINSNLLASRGDGLSILQSFQQGLNPNDIYNVSPVTILPVVNLTTSAASTLSAPANVTLTASASESNGTIGRVDFYQEGGYLGSCYTPPYSLQLSNLNAGAYFFNAVAVDATGQAASSGNVSVVVTPPITSASSNRYSRGSGTDPDFLSYLVAVNFEQGILLDATGNNFSKFPAAGNDPTKLPWFLRIQKSMAYQISYNPDSLTYSYPTSLAFENPLVAFGSGAGCTPLYVGQSYSFGIGTGGGYASANPIQDFNIQVYQDTAFSGTQVNIAPTIPLSLQLPRPGTPAWETFAANGYVKEQIVNDLSGNLIFKIAIQFVSGVSSADQWGQSGQPPLLVTVTAYTANYYLKISTIGETINKQNSTVYWMAVSNPNDPNVLGVNPTATTSGTYSTSFTMDFQQQPPWRSVFVGQPSFSGIPLPSSYLGKSLSELLHNSPWVSDSLWDSNRY